MYDAETVLAGRYRLHEVTGKGGTSLVYRATDTRLRRPVAVKAVQGENPQLLERARREAVMLARVSHPNVIRLFDGFEHAGRPHLVTELVNGPSLRSLQGRLRADQVATIAEQLADALAAVHRVGVVHSDVKPSNVLLGDRVRLIDFGIAHAAEDTTTLTTADALIGTEPYLAPERLWGRPGTAASDVYALGLVLLECFSGHRTFTGPLASSLARRVNEAPELSDAVPPRWRPLLTAMVDPDPDRRPTTTTVVEALRALRLGRAGGAAPAVVTASTTAPRPRPDRELFAPARPVDGPRLRRQVRRRARRRPTAPLPATAAG